MVNVIGPDVDDPLLLRSGASRLAEATSTAAHGRHDAHVRPDAGVGVLLHVRVRQRQCRGQ